jgi:site-specific recombinase XerD
MTLSRADIIRNAVQQSGLSTEKCDEVFDQIVEVLGRRMRDQRVMIEGLGCFGPVRPSGDAKGGQRGFFRPAKALLDRLEASPGHQVNGTVSQGELPASVSVEPIPEPAAPALQARSNGSTILPLRPEDDAIIERWLKARSSAEVTAGDGAALLYGGRKRITLGTAESVNLARRTMRAFARRCSVPLVQVGLSGNGGQYAAIPGSELHREIVEYWQDYAARARPRLAKYRESQVAKHLDWTTMAIGTQGWKSFVRCATDFYEWLAESGVRPVGTNPLAGINRRSVSVGGGKVLVVRKWCIELLRYPHMDPRERAVLYLLANGLRRSEVGGARLEHLELGARRLTIVGKRNKTRVVVLLPWVVKAVEAYLVSRRMSASPWLFPTKRGHLTGDQVYGLVEAVRDRAFPRPEDAHIRKYLTPHKFRHFFISQAWRRGAKDRVIMAVTGISDPTTLTRYITVEAEEVRRDVERIGRRRWF